MDVETGISIVTPFFNQTEIFWETYDAVVNQTFINWEWIIINDGSNQATSLSVLEKLNSLKNEKIKVISLPQNMGLPAARNHGVKHSFFDLIFFLDSDDLMEPCYLEKAFITLQLNPAFTFVNSWSTGFGAKNYLWQAGLDKREKFLQQNWVTFAGLFRKSLFSQLQFNEARRNGLEDWEFWLEAANNNYWGYTIPEYLFHYRIHDNQHNKWTNWDNGNQQKKITRRFQAKYSSLKKQFPDPQKQQYKSFTNLPVFTGISAPALNKRMVLIVLPWLELGGVEQFTLNYMASMSHVYDFIMVTTNAGAHSHADEFKKYCKQIYHFASLADAAAYATIWNYVITTWHIELLVISHSQPAYFILPYLKATYPSLAVIDILHLVEENWKQGGYPKIAVDYSTYINKHVVASNQINEWMAHRGLAQEKLQTIYINVDTNKIQPLDESVRLSKKMAFFELRSPDQLVLLFSGRLTAQKNTLLLPDIAAILTKKGINFIMAIAGDGPEKELLEEKVYQKKLHRYFSYLGPLSHTANIESIQLADILILPSAWEGIATVLYEAMAAATPVVATKVGGQQELIVPGTGEVVPVTNNIDQFIETYTNSLLSLAQNSILRKKTGEAARNRVVQHFNVSLTHHKLQLLFEELLSKPVIENTAFLPPETIADYYKNISNWTQEQSLPSALNWKKQRIMKLIKRIYKVSTRKRPLNYIWSKGKKSIG